MKTSLCALLLFFVAAAAHASSKYAGDYFGISYSDGNPVAGVNITVNDDGTISGKGAYVDLTDITVSGRVKESGKVKIIETSNGQRLKYKATFTANGKKFKAHLSTGNVFKGKKVSSGFTEAGIYSASDDQGDEGIFILQNNGSFYGILYDEDDDIISVEGTASSSGFFGEDDDGVTFAGKFNGNVISGTYSYEGETLGSFDGYKY